MRNISITVITYVVLIILSCSSGMQTEEVDEVANAVDSFTKHYFNLEFEASQHFCTPESNIWLSFIASNINKDDINIMNRQEGPIETETDNIEFTNDTSATATCTVKNFFKLDTLGKPVRIIDKEKYLIDIVKRDGKWLIKMEGLPQNEKQNHG